MKKQLFFTVACAAAFAGLAQTVVNVLPPQEANRQKVTVQVESATPPPVRSPRTVLAVVQNKAIIPGVDVSLSALTAKLTTMLPRFGLNAIDPYNHYGENLNRTRPDEPLPETSVMSLARLLEADGVVTATITGYEETSKNSGAFETYTFSVEVALNIARVDADDTVASPVGMGVEGAASTNIPCSAHTPAQFARNRPAIVRKLIEKAFKDAAGRLNSDAEVRPWLASAPRTPRTSRANLGIMDRRGVARTPGPDGKYALTMSDMDAALRKLVKAMQTDQRFMAALKSLKPLSGKTTPVAVGAGVANMTGDASYNGLTGAAVASVRTMLRDTSLFDVKDDAIEKILVERIVKGGNSPLEDGALMALLKQHGSPDVIFFGEVRKFGDYEGRNTYRVRLALHGIASGEVMWEGIVTVIK